MRCPKCGAPGTLFGDSARLRLYACPACGHTFGYRPRPRYLSREARRDRNRRRYGRLC